MENKVWKKMWFKGNPSIWCSSVSAPDSNGNVFAMVYDLEFPKGYWAGIDLDQWSEYEIVPAPHGVPRSIFAVISGDPDNPTLAYAETEGAAIATTATTPDAHGYIPVTFHTNEMRVVS